MAASTTTPLGNSTRSNPDRVLPPYVDIAEAPDALHLLDSDAPEQAETLLHLNGPEDDDELEAARMAFSSKEPQPISLGRMKQIYDQKERGTCLNLLKKRQKPDWRNSNFVFQPSDLGKKVSWRVHKHFLDFLVLVSRGIGLGALLPNANNNTSWLFCLDVRRNEKWDFRMANARLGFDPSERMLWIGKTHMSEDVWIAMVPDSGTLETDDALDLEEVARKRARKRRTHLTERHHKILLVFLANMLQRTGVRGIYLPETYPDLDINFQLTSDL